MKKCCLWVLALILLLSGCAQTPQTFPTEETFYDPSGYVVEGVFQYPDYTFSGEPDPMELRLEAVQAVRDLLSIRWSTPSLITYRKTGPMSEKAFRHEPDVTYAGTLYSNANTGLFQFLEYYDFETGRLIYPGETEEMKETLGAACADALIWGLTTVCPSVTGPYYPVHMVYKNGYLPVGDYTYDLTVNSYNYLPTYRITQQNGATVMLDAYSKVLPGDMLTSSVSNHAMMVISAPTVVLAADGGIDPENSYVMVQDQRAGSGEGFYEVKEDGQLLRYSGRTNAKIAFAELLDKSYLPVTTAEFIGERAYVQAYAKLDRPCSTPKELVSATVQSNYPLAVVRVVITDTESKAHVVERKLFSGGDQGGVPREFALNQLECLKDFETSDYNIPGCILEIEVVPSSGQRFTVVKLPL